MARVVGAAVLAFLLLVDLHGAGDLVERPAGFPRPRPTRSSCWAPRSTTGVPSSIFEARLEHARKLYEAGVAPVIVTVGGKATGDQFTEAEAGRDYLAPTPGAPYDALLAVPEGVDTLESMRAVSGGVRRARLAQRRPGDRPLARDARPAHGGRTPASRRRARRPGRARPCRPAPPSSATSSGRLRPICSTARPAERRRRTGDRLRGGPVLELGKAGRPGYPRGASCPSSATASSVGGSARLELEGGGDGRRRRPRVGLRQTEGRPPRAVGDRSRGDVALPRAVATSFWTGDLGRSIWRARLDDAERPPLWRGTHRFLAGGAADRPQRLDRRLVDPALTLHADDALPLHQQVFLLWVELRDQPPV